jgi:phosphoribosylanthranilate isomerase
MTWVKVCGLRDERGVGAALESGADAIGFVLAPSSRQVDAATARSLGAGLEIERFVVTVDLPPEGVLAAAEVAGATGVQPHGEHSRDASEAAAQAGLRVLRPVAVQDRLILNDIPGDQIPLLDRHHPVRHGGTGRSFDWTLVGDVGRPFVLAGGLTPENVSVAIGRLAPWGVDASSGLESSPGVKDPARIRAFVEEAKRT